MDGAPPHASCGVFPRGSWLAGLVGPAALEIPPADHPFWRGRGVPAHVLQVVSQLEDEKQGLARQLAECVDAKAATSSAVEWLQASNKKLTDKAAVIGAEAAQLRLAKSPQAVRDELTATTREAQALRDEIGALREELSAQAARHEELLELQAVRAPLLAFAAWLRALSLRGALTRDPLYTRRTPRRRCLRRTQRCRAWKTGRNSPSRAVRRRCMARHRLAGRHRRARRRRLAPRLRCGGCTRICERLGRRLTLRSRAPRQQRRRPSRVLPPQRLGRRLLKTDLRSTLRLRRRRSRRRRPQRRRARAALRWLALEPSSGDWNLRLTLPTGAWRAPRAPWLAWTAL